MSGSFIRKRLRNEATRHGLDKSYLMPSQVRARAARAKAAKVAMEEFQDSMGHASEFTSELDMMAEVRNRMTKEFTEVDARTGNKTGDE